MELNDLFDPRGHGHRQGPGVDGGRRDMDYTGDDFLRRHQQRQATSVAVGVPVNTDAVADGQDGLESTITQIPSLVSPSSAASKASTTAPKRCESVTSGSTDLSFLSDHPRPVSTETAPPPPARAESSPKPEAAPPAVPPVPTESMVALTTSLGEISFFSPSAPTPHYESSAKKKEDEEEEEPGVPPKAKLAFASSTGDNSLLSLGSIGSLGQSIDDLLSALKSTDDGGDAEKEGEGEKSSRSAMNEFDQMYARIMYPTTSNTAPPGTSQLHQRQHNGRNNSGESPNEYAYALGYNSHPRHEQRMYHEERMVPSEGMPPRMPNIYIQEQSGFHTASLRPKSNVAVQSDFPKFFQEWCQGGQRQQVTTPRTTNIGTKTKKKKSMISRKHPGRSDSTVSSNSIGSNSTGSFYSQKETDPAHKVYVTPNDNDVLMGRGGLANNWPGNHTYLQRVLEVQVTYRQLKSNEKAKKTQLAQDVVDYVHENLGGRFLKKDTSSKAGDSKGRRYRGGGAEDKWYVVTNHEARSKASQALRDDHSSEYRAAKRAKYGC